MLVKSEVWFSKDTQLNAMDGSDTKSPDIREFTVKAAASATIGQLFRLPASIRSGDTLYLFVRAIPTTRRRAPACGTAMSSPGTTQP